MSILFGPGIDDHESLAEGGSTAYAKRCLLEAFLEAPRVPCLLDPGRVGGGFCLCHPRAWEVDPAVVYLVRRGSRKRSPRELPCWCSTSIRPEGGRTPWKR
ncbi:protein of unknown function [Methylacidimicrobium sp. AP8]|nr:protein of unknown function [Methylacidimicrobium sp. AP8]